MESECLLLLLPVMRPIPGKNAGGREELLEWQQEDKGLGSKANMVLAKG